MTCAPTLPVMNWIQLKMYNTIPVLSSLIVHVVKQKYMKNDSDVLFFLLFAYIWIYKKHAKK